MQPFYSLAGKVSEVMHPNTWDPPEEGGGSLVTAAKGLPGWGLGHCAPPPKPSFLTNSLH